MKKKAILIFLLAGIFIKGYSQKNNKSKCKMIHDKELGLNIYKNIDSSAVIINEDAFNELILSQDFGFKGITKKYPSGQRVKIAYMINVDGKADFIKVIEPKGDNEIEAEAKRLIAMIPIYKPCKCNQEVVACDAKLNLPLIKVERKK
jgi:hypothetical protein